MNIPNEEDWRSEPWGLDEASAYKNFHGKTLDEAIRLFEINALYYQEDLTYMPSRVFAYYLDAYIAFLMSDDAKGHSDAASCFITLIDHKSETQRDVIVSSWQRIEPVLRMLAEHQDDFDAEWVIYGSFRERIDKIVRRSFETSFDTRVPEVVPECVTSREMALYSDRTLPWPVAVQVLWNSGFSEVDATFRKEDILRVFGPPDNAGGGEHPTYGLIPDWIHYRLPDCLLRFEFDGESISGVTFMPHVDSSK
jgi:hypothetical protein